MSENERFELIKCIGSFSEIKSNYKNFSKEKKQRFLIFVIIMMAKSIENGKKLLGLNECYNYLENGNYKIDGNDIVIADGEKRISIKKLYEKSLDLIEKELNNSNRDKKCICLRETYGKKDKNIYWFESPDGKKIADETSEEDYYIYSVNVNLISDDGYKIYFEFLRDFYLENRDIMSLQNIISCLEKYTVQKGHFRIKSTLTKAKDYNLKDFINEYINANSGEYEKHWSNIIPKYVEKNYTLKSAYAYVIKFIYGSLNENFDYEGYLNFANKKCDKGQIKALSQILAFYLIYKPLVNKKLYLMDILYNDSTDFSYFKLDVFKNFEIDETLQQDLMLQLNYIHSEYLSAIDKYNGCSKNIKKNILGKMKLQLEKMNLELKEKTRINELAKNFHLNEFLLNYNAVKLMIETIETGQFYITGFNNTYGMVSTNPNYKKVINIYNLDSASEKNLSRLLFNPSGENFSDAFNFFNLGLVSDDYESIKYKTLFNHTFDLNR